MSVSLGPISVVGATRFAVLSKTRITPMHSAQRVLVNGAKTPVFVLFEQEGRYWVQSVSGQDVPLDEIRAQYPDIYASFRKAVP